MTPRITVARTAAVTTRTIPLAGLLSSGRMIVRAIHVTETKKKKKKTRKTLPRRPRGERWRGTLLMAFGLMLVIEGLLPFLAPAAWRDMFRRIMAFTDGQLRFAGLVRCFSASRSSRWRGSARRTRAEAPHAQVAASGVRRGRSARRGARDRSGSRPPARSLPCARLRARDAADARVHRLAAHRHRPRSRPAHLQAGRPAVGPDDGPARRHDAAGRAHRRAPAEPRRA